MVAFLEKSMLVSDICHARAEVPENAAKRRVGRLHNSSTPPPPSLLDGACRARFCAGSRHSRNNKRTTARRALPPCCRTLAVTAPILPLLNNKESENDNRKSTQWKSVCGKSARTV